MTTTAHLRNPHDNGYDIATGRDIAAGEIIGAIGWDDTPDNPGLVLTIYEIPGQLSTGDEVLTPDDADEAIAMIARRGYALDESSIDDIRALIPTERTP